MRFVNVDIGRRSKINFQRLLPKISVLGRPIVLFSVTGLTLMIVWCRKSLFFLDTYLIEPDDRRSLSKGCALLNIGISFKKLITAGGWRSVSEFSLI